MSGKYNPERREYARLWQNKHYSALTAKQRLDRRLRANYGITADEYDALSLQQSGVCAICECPPDASRRLGKYLHVDHDHNTGKIRGLLCNNCNRGIGLLGDSSVRLLAASRYLNKHRNSE